MINKEARTSYICLKLDKTTDPNFNPASSKKSIQTMPRILSGWRHNYSVEGERVIPIPHIDSDGTEHIAHWVD